MDIEEIEDIAGQVTGENGKKGSLQQLPEDKQEALARIRTVRGHVKGIEEMIDKERYCIDILKQIAAVQSSLSKLANLLTEDHMRVCMSDAVRKGEEEGKIQELAEVLKYLRKA